MPTGDLYHRFVQYLHRGDERAMKQELKAYERNWLSNPNFSFRPDKYLAADLLLGEAQRLSGRNESLGRHLTGLQLTAYAKKHLHSDWLTGLARFEPDARVCLRWGEIVDELAALFPELPFSLHYSTLEDDFVTGRYEGSYALHVARRVDTVARPKLRPAVEAEYKAADEAVNEWIRWKEYTLQLMREYPSLFETTITRFQIKVSGEKLPRRSTTEQRYLALAKNWGAQNRGEGGLLDGVALLGIDFWARAKGEEFDPLVEEFVAANRQRLRANGYDAYDDQKGACAFCGKSYSVDWFCICTLHDHLLCRHSHPLGEPKDRRCPICGGEVVR